MADQCETCRFFWLDVPEFTPESMPEVVESGLCRRYPPVFTKEMPFDGTWAFPVVAITDWCGEFWPRDRLTAKLGYAGGT